MTNKIADKETKDGFVPIGEELLREVQVALDVRLGRSILTVGELMVLKRGSVVTLDRSLADQVDLCLNGTLVARGELVAVGDKFGVRILEIASEK